MMSQIKKIQTPLTNEIIRSLQVGDSVHLSGTIYTARDAAHELMVTAIQENQPLPFELENQIIFYAGPAPAPPGQVTGSIGPTTATRMDPYTNVLLEHGLKGMIGKGERGSEVRDAIRKHNAIYFAAIGGVAAIMAQCVKKTDVVAYESLGTEAVRKLEVVDLPIIVAIDFEGRNIYEKK